MASSSSVAMTGAAAGAAASERLYVAVLDTLGGVGRGKRLGT